MMELPNRGKRSVGLDMATEEGRDLLLQLCAKADVFLTNFRPQARSKAAHRPGDIRAVNPDIIYVRGSARASAGPRPSEAATTAAPSGAGAVRPTSSLTPTTTR